MKKIAFVFLLLLSAPFTFALSEKDIDVFAKNMNINIASIKLLIEAGKEYGIPEANILAFFRAINSGRLEIERGERFSRPTALIRIGFQYGEDNSTIINRLLGFLRKQDKKTKERIISDILLIQDDFLVSWTNMLSQTEAEWNKRYEGMNLRKKD